MKTWLIPNVRVNQNGRHIPGIAVKLNKLGDKNWQSIGRQVKLNITPCAHPLACIAINGCGR